MTKSGWTILRTELRLFGREPGALFWVIAFPAVLVGLIGLVPAFREANEDLGGQRVVDVYVSIAILLSIIVGSVQTMPAVLSTYREQRVLRRISTTPARPRELLIAQYIVHGGAMVVGAILALAVGWGFYGVDMPAHLVGFILVVVLAMAVCLVLGGIIAGATPNTRVASAVGMAVLFPLMFTAGVWFPVQSMPGLLGDVVALTPLGAAALGLDAATLGEWPPLSYLGIMVLWTAGLGVLAVRFFRWD